MYFEYKKLNQSNDLTLNDTEFCFVLQRLHKYFFLEKKKKKKQKTGTKLVDLNWHILLFICTSSSTRQDENLYRVWIKDLSTAYTFVKILKREILAYYLKI